MYICIYVYVYMFGLDAYLTELKAEASRNVLSNVTKLAHYSYASSWKNWEAIKTELTLKLNLPRGAPSL